MTTKDLHYKYDLEVKVLGQIYIKSVLSFVTITKGAGSLGGKVFDRGSRGCQFKSQ